MKKMHLKFNAHLQNLFEFNKKSKTNYMIYNILLSHDVLFELNANNVMPTDPYVTQLYTSVIKPATEIIEVSNDNDINKSLVDLNPSFIASELSLCSLDKSIRDEDRSIDEKSEQIIEFIKKYQDTILNYYSNGQNMTTQSSYTDLLSIIILKLDINSFIELFPLYNEFKLLSEVFLFRPDFAQNKQIQLCLMANNCEYETNVYKIYSLLAEDQAFMRKNKHEPRLSPSFMLANRDLICNEINMTTWDINDYPLAIDLRKCFYLSLQDVNYKEFLQRFIGRQKYKDEHFEMAVLLNDILLADGYYLKNKTIPSVTKTLAMKTFDVSLFKQFINMLIEIIDDRANKNMDSALMVCSTMIVMNIVYNILFNDELIDFHQYILSKSNDSPFEATKYTTILDAINSSDFKCRKITRDKISFIFNAFKSAGSYKYTDGNKVLRRISIALQSVSLNIFEMKHNETYYCKANDPYDHQTYYNTGIKKERKTND